MMGTTSSPRSIGSAPPGQKSICTSTMTSASPGRRTCSGFAMKCLPRPIVPEVWRATGPFLPAIRRTACTRDRTAPRTAPLRVHDAFHSGSTCMSMPIGAPRAEPSSVPAVSDHDSPVSLSFWLTDRPRTVSVQPTTTLVELLRDGLGLTGTKIGCDRGACSACTVWIDDDVAASCMTFALDVRGKRVTTIEGLADGERLHAVQRAFIACDAMQCGFCTPGMIMSCAALVDRNPDCTLEDVKTAISGHLCRCGEYPN